MDRATQYAIDVESGRVVAGPLVRLACHRHLRDLERSDGLYYDERAAQVGYRFFERILCHSDGIYSGKPFLLSSWQAFIVGSLLGWYRGGRRRYRSAYIEVGKGNGKTPMGAGLMLFGLVVDGEDGAEIYSAATSADQASILFRDARRMVQASPYLSEILDCRTHAIHNRETGGFLRAISSERRGLDGKRVHMAVIDEIHEHRSPIVVQKMRAGTKGRANPLIIETTNSGFDRSGICWEHHSYSRKILEGSLENDRWFAFVAGLDEGDDWRDESCWVKPNPNLGVSITLDYLREQVDEARGMPSREAIVRRLNFCEWSIDASSWLDMRCWSDLETDITREDVIGAIGYGGLDLSSTTDLTAFVLVFPEFNPWRVLSRFWLPADEIRQRELRDGVPYSDWASAGWLKLLPGEVIDYDLVESDLLEWLDGLSVKEIAYDRWGAARIRMNLEREGLTMVMFGQGYGSMSAPSKSLERMVKQRGFVTDGNPVLRWNAANAKVTLGANEAIKPTKERSEGRIDGIVALVMAIARAELHGIRPRYYEGGLRIWG